MAATDVLPAPDDRQGHRRRPFTTWVKKLTNFKNSEGDRAKRQSKKNKKRSVKGNPYPESGTVSNGITHGSVGNDASTNGRSACSFTTTQTEGHDAVEQPGCGSAGDRSPPTAGGLSAAGTASTEHDHVPSHGASSLAGTSRTVGGGIDSSRRGGDSTFSSPAPSVRSLTTTLTTIQSVGPHASAQNTTASHGQNQNQTQSIQFSQPFPTTSPASAIPAHLAPTGNPTTYSSATANSLLTDNASTLTLASSSKRRRRRSMDTDASVRALAPSSVWGGSRESLPLSVLSANIDPTGNATTPGLHGSSSRIGAERNSIYSSTGVAPAMAGERNSLYAKQGDGASVRSGLLGHGRAESVNGPIASPLASPLETPTDNGAKVDKEARTKDAQ